MYLDFFRNLFLPRNGVMGRERGGIYGVCFLRGVVDVEVFYFIFEFFFFFLPPIRLVSVIFLFFIVMDHFHFLFILKSPFFVCFFLCFFPIYLVSFSFFLVYLPLAPQFTYPYPFSLQHSSLIFSPVSPSSLLFLSSPLSRFLFCFPFQYSSLLSLTLPYDNLPFSLHHLFPFLSFSLSTPSLLPPQ